VAGLYWLWQQPDGDAGASKPPRRKRIMSQWKPEPLEMLPAPQWDEITDTKQPESRALMSARSMAMAMAMIAGLFHAPSGRV
jgi:hypothetical protein